MTYQKAIEIAKKCAKMNDINYVVYGYPRRHWWNRHKYNFLDIHSFMKVQRVKTIARLLTITPTGTIAQ